MVSYFQYEYIHSDKDNQDITLEFLKLFRVAGDLGRDDAHIMMRNEYNIGRFNAREGKEPNENVYVQQVIIQLQLTWPSQGSNWIMTFLSLMFNSFVRVSDSSDGLTVRWCHNGRDSVSNHQPRGCLLNRLFIRRSRKTSKLRVTGLYAGNSPATGEFPAQMACNAKNVSIWWRHHEVS